MAKKKVLYISPIHPDSLGAGKAKRAQQWLSTLEKSNEVDLLVLQPGVTSTRLSSESTNRHTLHLSYSRSVRIWRFCKTLLAIGFNQPLKSGSTTLNWLPLMAEHREVLQLFFRGRKYDKIVCFRLYGVEFAQFLQEITSCKRLDIDCDDLEAETWAKLSRLHIQSGNKLSGWRYWLSSRQFLLSEGILKQSDEVFLCSQEDKDRLLRRHPGLNITVFPNKIKQPEGYLPEAENPYSLLFVGSLNYLPNAHAAIWFLEQVYKPLKTLDPRWTYTVVGYQASLELKAALKYPGVNLQENLPEMRSAYLNNAIVVAPIFAGGGTKLKVLEAMSYQRPVVATLEGVSGLGLEDGKQFLCASDAETFMRRCQDLTTKTGLYNQITAVAYKTVIGRFSY